VASANDLRTSSEFMTKRSIQGRNLAWSVGIFSIAMVLRFLYQWEIKDHPLSRQLFLDPAFYDRWARAIAAGDWLGQGVFYANPLYPYFLALIYRCCGYSLFLVKLFQSVLGGLTCWMIALIGRQIFDRATGILSGLMAALYAPFIFYEGTLTISTLGMFLSLLTVFLLLRSAEIGPWRSFGAGAVWGLRALARFDLTFLAAAIWLLAHRDERTFHRRLKLAALFCLGVTVIILPVSARNFLVEGKLVAITAHGGETFYGGNNPWASGSYAPPPGVRPGPEYEHEDFRRLASERLGRELSLSESSSYWLDQAMAFIRDHPGRYARLQFKKLLLFWGPGEIPDNRNFHFFRRFSIVLRLPLLNFGILCPVALLGLLLELRNWRRSLLLYMQIFLSMLSVLFFFVLARYRLPTVPFLMLFAAYALHWSFRSWRDRRWRFLLVCWIPTCSLLIFFALQTRGLSQTGFESRYETLGVALIREGRVDEGISELESVIRLNPRRVTTHFNLGVAYLEEKGNYRLAAQKFKEVVGLQDDYPQAHYMLAKAYEGMRRTQEAAEEFRRELDFWPEDTSTRLSLGMAYVKLEQWVEAEVQFRKLIEKEPDKVLGHQLLGNVLYLQGRPKEAAASWERAVQLNPSDEELRKGLETLRERMSSQDGSTP